MSGAVGLLMAGGAAGGGFTPLDVPDLWAWFQPSGRTIASGEITAWTDDSGNGRHASAPDSLKFPSDPGNGFVRFDGDDLLEIAGHARPAVVTVYVAVRVDAGPTATQGVISQAGAGSKVALAVDGAHA